MEHVAQRPNSERDTVGYHFPSFKRKMEGNDGGFHACYVWRQPPPANSGRNSNRLSASKLAKRKPRQAWLDLHVGTVAATHTSRMEPAVQASRWARQAWAQGGGTDQSGRRTPRPLGSILIATPFQSHLFKCLRSVTHTVFICTQTHTHSHTHSQTKERRKLLLF